MKYSTEGATIQVSLTEGELSLRGLYYPIYGFAEDRWLKAAAMYWPALIRLLPEPLPFPESETVRKLTDELGFIVQRPPGDSVPAVADRFLSLVKDHGEALRQRFGIPPEVRAQLTPVPAARRQEPIPWDDDGVFKTFGVTHVAKLLPAVREALIEHGLAVWPLRPIAGLYAEAGRPVMRTRDGCFAPPDDPRVDFSPDPTWVAMHDEMVLLVGSTVALDFANANRLVPITHLDSVFARAQEWTADQLATILLERPDERLAHPTSDIAQRIGLLALELVVPDQLEVLPVEKIIEIRRRYGPEFLAFSREVVQAANDLAELADVRDEAVLELYLRDVVTTRFVKPMDELRAMLRSLKLDSTTVAINVKTELPAGTLLSAGAYATGHPLLAGTGVAALGLLAMRRGFLQQRQAAVQSSPSASFLLHTQQTVQPRRLLDQTVRRVQQILGGPDRAKTD